MKLLIYNTVLCLNMIRAQDWNLPITRRWCIRARVARWRDEGGERVTRRLRPQDVKPTTLTPALRLPVALYQPGLLKGPEWTPPAIQTLSCWLENDLWGRTELVMSGLVARTSSSQLAAGKRASKGQWTNAPKCEFRFEKHPQSVHIFCVQTIWTPAGLTEVN